MTKSSTLAVPGDDVARVADGSDRRSRCGSTLEAACGRYTSRVPVDSRTSGVNDTRMQAQCRGSARTLSWSNARSCVGQCRPGVEASSCNVHANILPPMQRQGNTPVASVRLSVCSVYTLLYITGLSTDN